MEVIIANPQKRVKDTYASSPIVGLTVRANGEEAVSIIDQNGNIANAGIAPPPVAPTLANAGSGNLLANQYVAYVYAYAFDDDQFQFIENDLAINGSLAPRSNGSPGTVLHIAGSNQKVNVTCTKTIADYITRIWVFRTAYFATSLEAQTAADAQQVFYVGEAVNDGMAGTVVYEDNQALVGTDQIELDNYAAPQFQFVIYYDPYWFGFGNFPFQAAASWTGSTVTLTGVDEWFDGRNGQNLSLEGIDQTYKFKWLTATTAAATLDGSTPVAIGSTGTGRVTVQGPATTLFRSKRRNPFSWGRTVSIGDALVPSLYTFKIGGGTGTAIAVIPNEPILKLDCEYPAKCFTLNLGAVGTSGFESSLRIISDVYSVSSHWSQFAATTPSGQNVLWGMDYKNFAILQSNGVSQIPISGPIPKILRRLTRNRSQQLLAHGCYDPRTELNCIWVTTADSLSLVNYLIFQHAPTGYWGFVDDLDVLCSALIQDTVTNTHKVFVGTQTGLLGQVFVEGKFDNWLPDDGLYTGEIATATGTTITREGTDSLNVADDGLIGNWCLITNADGEEEQWARISEVTVDELTFDLIRPAYGVVTTALNPVPPEGSKFYIGMIQCLARKDYDLNQPHVQKALKEFYMTQENAEANDTLIRFYRENALAYQQQFAILQNTDTENLWQRQLQLPSNRVFSYGIEIINRAYSDWRFLNFVMVEAVKP